MNHLPEPQNPTAPRTGRSQCWRKECRDANGDYRTVVYSGGTIRAICHQATYGADLTLRAELWHHLQDIAA